ncbi:MULTISPECIES: flavin-containing monooxygenase [Burkholderiaceae]|uniref:Cyclohexanone monooxygenase n=1 Tax=Caballeronia sordidicola TaxID=196367 RepID=A0A242MFA6_CABSO|nr:MULTISPECIES: NAD(P)/FAD-dependent oxidoreductase [Burkholderiaceae]OTP69984.1 Cyclohexanone monooxygenase [Caballeronia sordidicola]
MPQDASSPAANEPERIDIAVIGSGFAGLCMAIRLKQAGMNDFFVAEQAASLGGTWRDNHYPGCACDVQAHVYSFSFAPHPGWTRLYAPQAEIRAYLEDCAARFGIGAHLRFNETLQRATFDEPTQRWILRFSTGRKVSARVLIAGMGGLSRASVPAIPGIDTFEGPCFHSQHWDHEMPLEGKRVAVIGTGASAIQFVPEIAARVAHLDVFQRTPPWIMPKNDRKLGKLERWILKHVPLAQWLLRATLYWMLEARVLGFVVHPALMKVIQKVALRHLHKQVADPELRLALTPDYTIGCKRILISNDYYPAVSRSNVSVVTQPIVRVEPNAVVTADNVRHPADCIIFGTGFQVSKPFTRGVIIGRGGVRITDTWRDGAHAYLGTTLPDYPNFFMLVGPNSGLAHNSMVYMIESQVTYVMEALAYMRDRGVASIDVKPEVEAEYNVRIQQQLNRAIWAKGGCKSWYIDPASGRNTALWPGFSWKFRKASSVFKPDEYIMQPAISRTNV